MSNTVTTAGLKPRHKRLLLALGVLIAVAAIVALVLNAFQSNLVFFFTPTQVVAKEAPQGKTFRLGGMVEEGSVQREGTRVNFIVTDTVQKVSVVYDGILPDLFKEGKGVVAQGRMSGNAFTASEVLAKHDENYMPPEAAEAMAQAKKAKAMATTTSSTTISNTTGKTP
jgi:cytochrome c-type biogenesis protein CcmE